MQQSSSFANNQEQKLILKERTNSKENILKVDDTKSAKNPTFSYIGPTNLKLHTKSFKLPMEKENPPIRINNLNSTRPTKVMSLIGEEKRNSNSDGIFLKIKLFFLVFVFYFHLNLNLRIYRRRFIFFSKSKETRNIKLKIKKSFYTDIDS